MLVIENKSLLMQEVDLTKTDYKVLGGTKIYGVLGVIQIYPISYLFVITGQKLIYEITALERIRIYEITDTQLITLHKEGSADNREYELAINKVMKWGFYYSPDVDLTKRFMPGEDEGENDWVRDSAVLQVGHRKF